MQAQLIPTEPPRRRPARARVLTASTGDPRRRVAVGVPEWRLDDRTREVGRRGVASAREALREALARQAAA